MFNRATIVLQLHTMSYMFAIQFFRRMSLPKNVITVVTAVLPLSPLPCHPLARKVIVSDQLDIIMAGYDKTKTHYKPITSVQNAMTNFVFHTAILTHII